MGERSEEASRLKVLAEGLKRRSVGCRMMGGWKGQMHLKSREGLRGIRRPSESQPSGGKGPRRPGRWRVMLRAWARTQHFQGGHLGKE